MVSIVENESLSLKQRVFKVQRLTLALFALGTLQNMTLSITVL